MRDTIPMPWATDAERTADVEKHATMLAAATSCLGRRLHLAPGEVDGATVVGVAYDLAHVVLDRCDAAGEFRDARDEAVAHSLTFLVVAFSESARDPERRAFLDSFYREVWARFLVEQDALQRS